MEGRETLRFAAPLMNHLHGRFPAHFVEQDVVGHMETEKAGGEGEQGQMSVAIAFADLAGYARLTDERGDEEAVGRSSASSRRSSRRCRSTRA